MESGLGNWIKLKRVERNLTQQEVSQRISVTQSTLSAWERDKLKPNLDQLIVLLDFFDLSLEDVPAKFLKKKGADRMKRVSVHELAVVADSVRTFGGQEYQLKGTLAFSDNGEVEKAVNIYYSARTVVKDNKVVAKRKNKEDELTFVTPRKIRSK